MKAPTFVDARKERLGPADALRLAREAEDVYVARGKTVQHFRMTAAPPADADLLKALLGPTGNLRAPALRVGTSLLVGLDRDTYRKVLGI